MWITSGRSEYQRQYEPILYENRNRVPRSSDPNYHLSTDIADKSKCW